MIGRLAFVFAAAALLAGCTDADWDQAFAYAGLGGDQAKQTAPQTDAAQSDTAQADAVQSSAPPKMEAAAPDSWCAEVAKAAETEAANQGFDAQTQKNRAQAALQQCAHPSVAVQ